MKSRRSRRRIADPLRHPGAAQRNQGPMTADDSASSGRRSA
ncbi:hypothetical protein DA075_27410 [Methylobacterium currus]|uniref:Uncharacterized protein n=1 Tax=Methylobacterium currus TaxID=2051553 RepID=A0A2R4WRH3_9HYPH|nr:hypothetical protein DA075_27410 [Methylobacterium currus]